MTDEVQGAGPVTPSRLVQALDRVRTGRVAVISGPPGHGKHELVSAWLRTRPDVTALHQTGTALDGLRQAVDGFDGSLLAVVVSNPELTRDATFVGRLLEFAERQPRIRLVFVGRSRPNAPLGSLAARGLLVDLDADQLALTRQEMAAALRPSNPGLSEQAVDTFVQQLRGWPALVRMFADEPASWSHAAKVTRLSDSYIAEEVLAGLPEGDLRFLQEVSALPTLDPLAASWMTGRGDAAAQLSRLQALGVPISWDDANTIRLHPMLRDHLNRTLLRTEPERSRELSQRAALWLRNRQRPLEAVRLAMQVGLTDLAWMLAAEFITVHMHRPELVQALPQLVDLLPPGWEVDTVRSISRGLATPQTMVAQMIAIDFDQMVSRSDTGRLGYTSFVLGMVRRVGYPHDSRLASALEMAAAADSPGVHELDLAMLATVQVEYGLWQLHHGHLDEARETLLSSLGIARVLNVPWVIVTALSALAFVNAYQGSIAAALRLADEAILTSSDAVFVTDVLDEQALVALALAAIDTGDLAAAERWVDQLERHDEHGVENDALRTYASAMLATARGEAETARRLIGAHRDQPRRNTPVFHEMLLVEAAFNAALLGDDQQLMRDEFDRLVALGLPDSLTGRQVQEARLALALGEPHRAHDLLLPLVEQREHPFTHARHTLYMLMLFGVAADELNRTDEALQAFQRAGVLAERLGLNTPNARHTKVAVASRKEVPLTEAERHVLENLDPSRTLGETADALFISQNTLKTHLRRIYRKLGVANREQALERARMMGLHRPSTS